MQVDAGVVAQTLGDELALGVEVLHTLARHGHGDQIADDIFFRLARAARGKRAERRQRASGKVVAIH